MVRHAETLKWAHTEQKQIYMSDTLQYSYSKYLIRSFNEYIYALTGFKTPKVSWKAAAHSLIADYSNVPLQPYGILFLLRTNNLGRSQDDFLYYLLPVNRRRPKPYSGMMPYW